MTPHRRLVWPLGNVSAPILVPVVATRLKVGDEAPEVPDRVAAGQQLAPGIDEAEGGGHVAAPGEGPRRLDARSAGAGRLHLSAAPANEVGWLAGALHWFEAGA